MKFSLFLLILFSMMGCQTGEQHPSGSFTTQPDYKPPYFADQHRIEKLKASIPAIDSLYRKYAIENHYPGLTYGIVADGQLIHTASFGMSNLEKQIAATPSSLFRIASMTKSFMAMAILKLRDEGKLHLQDPASKYIPQLKKIQRLTRDSPPITIQHLLTMSAGFPEDNPWGDRQLADSNEELMKLVETGLSFSNTSGVEYEYSNLGFGLLGYIIQQVSGQRFEDYITENILKPLGMKDSRWEFNSVPESVLALGYRWEEEQWKPEPILHDGAFGAMGGLICSIEDFSKYMAFHLAAWPPRNDPDEGPVRRSTVREMHQLWRTNPYSPAQDQYGPVAFGYAYGLGWRKDARGIVRISHSGGLPGYGSEWRIYPDYGLGIVSFSNRTYGAPSGANGIALDSLLAMAGLQPRVLPVAEILAQRKSQLLEIIPEWKSVPENLFAENFFMDQSLELRREETVAIFNEAGKIGNISEITPENQLRGSFVMEGMRKNIRVFFTLTPESEPLIQHLSFSIVE